MITLVETWKIPRESKEWVGPITVTVDGAVTTTNIKIAILPNGIRPTAPDWKTPDVDPDPPATAPGAMVGPGTTFVLAHGLYGIWVQITDTPEIPVIEPGDVGFIRIT